MLALITASLVLIAMLGPDQALITRNALAGGSGDGFNRHNQVSCAAVSISVKPP